MQIKVVEKLNPLAVHAVCSTPASAQRWIDVNAKEYCAKGYFADKTLTPDSFTVATRAAYEAREQTTYQRIRSGECFQFDKGGEVFIKTRGGFRPGRGGQLHSCQPRVAVWFYDPGHGLLA